jgi:hypothetical protein
MHQLRAPVRASWVCSMSAVHSKPLGQSAVEPHVTSMVTAAMESERSGRNKAHDAIVCSFSMLKY